MNKLKFIITSLLLFVLQAGFCQTQLTAIDQFPPSMCEESFGSARVSNIDLTSLEPSIYGGGGATYSWFSDAALTNPVATPNNVIVTIGSVFYVIVDDGTSSDTATVTYAIYEIPYFWDYTPAALCEDVAGGGTASGVALTSHQDSINGCSTTQFTWFFDAALSTPVANPNNVTVSDGQVFYVELYNTLFNCTNMTSITFTVNPKPVAIDQFPTLCVEMENGVNADVDLTSFNKDVNGGTINSVTWYKDATLTIPVVTPSDFEVSNGQTFYALVSNENCQDIATVTINLNPLPNADFRVNPNSTTMLDPRFDFIDQSISFANPSTLSYVWDFAGLDYSSLQNPSYLFPADTGNHLIHLTVTDVNGCYHTTTNIAVVNEEYSIYIPNAFTPDGDGVNDYFIPKGFGLAELNYSLFVFDRSGGALFESHNPNDGWDGSYKGEMVANGTYVWKVIFDDFNGIKHEKIGQLNIFR